MLAKVVQEWLSEYKSLSEEEMHTYAASIRHNGELVNCLHELFDEQCEVQILDPVCHQLFEFYRSSEPELQRFSLELLPSLVWLYLSLLSKGDKKRCGGVEAFLLAVYNLETCTEDGKPKEKTFRIPSFAKHSIYHEPQTLSSLPLTEALLSRYNTEPGVWRGGPYPQYEAINGQNRHEVLSYLQQCYNADIATLSARSHRIFCKMCSRIVTTGFSNLLSGDEEDKAGETTHSTTDLEAMRRPSHSGEVLSRIAVSPALLIEMLSGLYFVMFNGQAGPAAQAVVDIHHRASYELFADVVLVTNAVRNSLRENPSGQPEDGPIGISLALSPASSNYTLSKTAITNASFRAQKLPDDIPVQPDDTPKLPTIDEDTDSGSKPKGWKGLLTKKDKTEKSRLKEARNSDGNLKSGVQLNGESADSVQVSVARGSMRTPVDMLEMQAYNKNSMATEEQNSSPYPSKHVSPATKISGSGMKNSISNKDIRNTKMAAGHIRHSSGGSVNSESLSTDL